MMFSKLGVLNAFSIYVLFSLWVYQDVVVSGGRSVVTF